MRVIGKVRQKGGALSFSLGNTLPIISLASPRRLRLMPSGLPVRRRRLVELLPGCALTPSYRLIPLVSQCNGSNFQLRVLDKEARVSDEAEETGRRLAL